MALLRLGAVDWPETQTILRQHDLGGAIESFEKFLRERYELPELGLNNHQFAQFKEGVLK